jgi:hypothetical protein
MFDELFKSARWCSATSAAHSCKDVWSICSIALIKVRPYYLWFAKLVIKC